MKKVKINYRGETFLLKESVLRTKDYHGKSITPVVEIGRVEGATIIKQYIKKKYPTIKSASVSDTFSNGNSIDVYIFNKDGSEVPTDVLKDVDTFAQTLRMGRFNGMNDMYEHNDWKRQTDDGIRFESYCKYISVYNKPKFGTLEWGMKELSNGRTKSETVFYMDINKKVKFLNL